MRSLTNTNDRGDAKHNGNDGSNKNTSNGNNGNSNSGLIPLQCSGTDAVLSHVVKVTAQFDALRVADFSPKKFTVLNLALHSSPSYLRNKARMRNF